MIGWIVFGIIAILLVIDVWRNNWAGTKAVLGIFRNTVVRRILRILLVIVITVGSLFIISSIGFVAQSKYPDNTGLMWLTLLPIIAAMLVIWICLISAGALESIARGFASMFGVNVATQTMIERWEKGFLSTAFWIYLILAFYPFWNPWTGGLHPTLMIGLLFGGMALATYARWAAGAGKKSKIFGLIIVPLLFMYCLGVKYPDKFEFLGSLANFGRAKKELKQAGLNLNSAVDDRKTKSKEDALPIVEHLRVAKLKDGIIPLDSEGEEIKLKEHEKDLVRIIKKLDGADLKSDVPELADYLDPTVNSEFYFIKFKDSKGRYSSDSTMGYIEVNDIEQEVIDIPKEPEINNPNKKPKLEDTPILTVPLPGGGYKKIISLSLKWSEKVVPPKDVYCVFSGPSSALVKFEANGMIGPATNTNYGRSSEWLKGFRFKGTEGEKLTVEIIPK